MENAYKRVNGNYPFFKWIRGFYNCREGGCVDGFQKGRRMDLLLCAEVYVSPSVLSTQGVIQFQRLLYALDLFLRD